MNVSGPINWFHRQQKRISLVSGLFSAACFMAFLVFLLLNSSRLAQSDQDFAFTPIVPVSLSAVGILLSNKRPENLVSWILLLAGFLSQTIYLGPVAKLLLALESEPDLVLVIFVNLWPWLSGLISTLLAFAFVIFPTGRLLSARWRPAYWLLGLQILVSVGRGLYLTIDLVRSFSLARAGRLEITLAPLASSGPLSTTLHTRAMPEQLQVTLAIGGIALGMVLLGMVSLVKRFRSGTALERQQVKWLIFALAFWAFAIVVVVGPFNGPILLLNLVVPLVIAAMAIAILRYRLYNIDLIINQTLVYGLLTGCLAALYFGSVLTLQQVFQRVTGGQSPLALVASTLLIAVVFAPLRRRLQDFIDRRFYRSKYDAAETLNRFASLARTEVDVDAMSAALVSAVQQSLQPRAVSLWLKKDTSRQ